MAASPRPRLLFIDAYDSYSNNIIALLRRATPAAISVIRIDDPRFLHDEPALHAFLRPFAAVVIGPGPGDPRRPQDVGLIARIWRLPADRVLPVLGICLGFQTLVLAFGGAVDRLREPRHGVVTRVAHCGRSLFEGLGEVRATQYHSIHATLGHGADGVGLDAPDSWLPAKAAPLLMPLAWDFGDARNGPVLMAVGHTEKPFRGVQYHPESICTNGDGAAVVRNWWAEVRCWEAGRNVSSRRVASRHPSTSPSLEPDSGYGTDIESDHSPSGDATTRSDASDGAPRNDLTETCTRQVAFRSVDFPLEVDAVAMLSGLVRDESGRCPFILESGTKAGRPVRADTGRYSILCFVEDNLEVFRYWADTRTLEHSKHGAVIDTRQSCTADVLEQLKEWTAQHRHIGGQPNLPFWGGLVGYVSYEAALELIDVQGQSAAGGCADVTFISVQRTLIIDHVCGRVHVQSLRTDDGEWLDHISERIDSVVVDQKHLQPGLSDQQWSNVVHHPEQESYCAKVRTCQSYIRAGDAYELCLTDRSNVRFDCKDGGPPTWDLYQRLRLSNPAPFGAYMAFDDISIASSSPERFLAWTRDKHCEFRPIKGTVQKAPGVTKDSAAMILKSDKEQAENLMIVDLIRHDLNGVLRFSGGEAHVAKLMQVEEYETVYQLVSVISGRLGDTSRKDATYLDAFLDEDGPSGIDVLRASLPPGSMTGAPKKRACEVLGNIENRRRGLYSGVLGYLDVGGGGDFSVVIRSIIKDREGFSVSAGGAVTSLSSPMAEWEEMMGKSNAVRL